MGKLSDEQLLKRANHASRNLGVLATLASLVALLLTSLLFFKGPPHFMGMLGLAAGVIAAAYWVLMVAAKRGDPASVSGPIVIMGLQLALGLIGTVLRATTSPEAAGAGMWGAIIIPVLVIIALYSSKKVLVELKARGLWEQVFGAAKPSGQLCLIGNMLLVVGFLGMNGGAVAVGVHAGMETAAKQRKANAFRTIVMVEEKAFMEALRKACNPADSAGAEAARADMQQKLQALRAKVEAAKQQASDNEPLFNILSTYGRAVDMWAKGLEAMTTPGADAAKGQQMLKDGDRLREIAIKEFDQTYSFPPKAPW